jgi:CheY-like chemotaxis protein
VRILIAEDFEAFRHLISSMLQQKPEYQIVCEVWDGFEAVQKAEELRPDLILLDIGLPTLNGIEAARRIRKLSPETKILFVSQESTLDVVQEALSTGAEGYVVKADAGSELIPAVSAVVRGERFVGERFADADFVVASNPLPRFGNRLSTPNSKKYGTIAHHEAGFYSDDRGLLDGFTEFIGCALKAGNAAVVVATESHRDSLLPRLQAYGLDVAAAIEQGRYVALAAASALSRFMVHDSPDPVMFLGVADKLITTAAKSLVREHPRVAICGECDPPLWTLGNGLAAIRFERLWNMVAKQYDVDILCGYLLSSSQGKENSHIFQRICEQHSAVYFR